jgi:hypothetical protein
MYFDSSDRMTKAELETVIAVVLWFVFAVMLLERW